MDIRWDLQVHRNNGKWREKESPTEKKILLVASAGKGNTLKIFRFMEIYMFDIQKHPMPSKLIFIQQNIQQLVNIRPHVG